MTKKEELKEKIKQAEQLVNDLKAGLETLEREPTFERVAKGNNYCSIKTNSGQFFISECIEAGSLYDICCYYYNNYFHTKERAEDVLNKIKFLLKIERFHDIYCPDYITDWDCRADKYFVYYDEDLKKYCVDWTDTDKNPVIVYFPDDKTAHVVCGKLNEELKNKKG